MRYPPEQRERTRQRILDAAAVVFRRHGFQAASVDLVMAEAGLTAGGFYSHFKSKEDLFAATLVRDLQQARVIRGLDSEPLAGADRIRSIAAKYLHPTHLRRIESGCALPPLLAELPRQGAHLRSAFEENFISVIAALEPHLTAQQPSEKQEQALAILAMMVGGMSLARAVADDTLADRLLSACRAMIDVILKSGEKSSPL